jgi:CheY-like chemotaxis protein
MKDTDAVTGQGDGSAEAVNMAEVGRLVSKVAHDINNPLAAIIGFADLLQVERSPEKQQRYARIISGQAERARKLVENLVMHARQKAPQMRALDVNALVSHVITLREIQLDVEGIRLSSSLAPGLPQVDGDAHQLSQVIYNVLLNAEQAVTSRSGPREILVETALGDGEVVIRVKDNGVGMEEDVRTQMFEAFFTTRNKGGGSGLGLSVSRDIVSRHEGRIEVESTKGVGTTMAIHLPAHAVEPVGASPAATSGLQGRTVLVVEDQEYLLDLYGELFSALGCKVLRGQSVDEALAHCRAGGVDLIVLNYRLPDRGAQRLVNTLRAELPALTTRAIAITVDPLDVATRQWLDSEKVASIAKPFTLEEIQTLATKVLSASTHA